MLIRYFVGKSFILLRFRAANWHFVVPSVYMNYFKECLVPQGLACRQDRSSTDRLLRATRNKLHHPRTTLMLSTRQPPASPRPRLLRLVRHCVSGDPEESSSPTSFSLKTSTCEHPLPIIPCPIFLLIFCSNKVYLFFL